MLIPLLIFKGQHLRMCLGLFSLFSFSLFLCFSNVEILNPSGRAWFPRRPWTKGKGLVWCGCIFNTYWAYEILKEMFLSLWRVRQVFLVSLENGATRYTWMHAVAMSCIGACSDIIEGEFYSRFCSFKPEWLCFFVFFSWNTMINFLRFLAILLSLMILSRFKMTK